MELKKTEIVKIMHMSIYITLHFHNIKLLDVDKHSNSVCDFRSLLICSSLSMLELYRTLSVFNEKLVNIKGGVEGLRWKFKRVSKSCFLSVMQELFRIWRLVCQLYHPERKSVKSYLVWLLESTNHSTGKMSHGLFLRTKFKLYEVVCHFDVLLLLIPNPFIIEKRMFLTREITKKPLKTRWNFNFQLTIIPSFFR